MKDISGIERAAFSIDEAAHRLNSCRDKIYGAINAGKLRAKKDGRRTIILASDLEDYLANLPKFEPKATA
jgi:excisionase family DNA binding protein